MELKLVASTQDGNSTLHKYEIGDYTVYDEQTEDNKYSDIIIVLKDTANRYSPKIYTDQKSGSNIKGFEIETKGYGSLDIKDIEDVIKGYQNAIEVVKILTDKYNK